MNTLRGTIAALFLAANTTFWACIVFVLGLLRALMPVRRWRDAVTGWMDIVIDGWVGGNRIMNSALGLFRVRSTWNTTTPLKADGKYLVICNHQSWADILVLQNTLRGVLPPLKFFTKAQLIWLPFLGQAMWLLGFPYVRRGGGGDSKSIAASCAVFRLHPVSILNFAEGTRYTEAKWQKGDQARRHLLRPKTGGIAHVLGEMGTELDSVIDITIDYPTGAPTFWQFLCGGAPLVEFDLHSLPVPVAAADRTLTETEHRNLSDWVTDRWQIKDAWLDAQRGT